MREGHVTAQFTMPAVYSYLKQEFVYSALRFVITDKADKFLVQYMLGIVRS